MEHCVRQLAAIGVPKDACSICVIKLVSNLIMYRSQSKAFICLVMMAYWMNPKPSFCTRPYDVIELYAGRARISRIAKAAGLNAIASDKLYDPSPKSSLELNSNSGFVLLGQCNPLPPIL